MAIRMWASKNGQTNQGTNLSLGKDDLLRDGDNKVIKNLSIADGDYSSTLGSTMSFSNTALSYTLSNDAS